MLELFWPWSEIAKYKREAAEMHRHLDRLRNEVDNSRVREGALREQMRLLIKNDSRDKRGKFKKEG